MFFCIDLAQVLYWPVCELVPFPPCSFPEYSTSFPYLFPTLAPVTADLAIFDCFFPSTVNNDFPPLGRAPPPIPSSYAMAPPLSSVDTAASPFYFRIGQVGALRPLVSTSLFSHFSPLLFRPLFLISVRRDLPRSSPRHQLL